MVGGSCGVNQAVQASRRHPEIRTVVLLSGGTDAQGEAHIKSSATLPIFGAASEEDTDAAAAIQKIAGLSAHRDSHVEMFEDAGHAASMFAKQQDLEADIVIWFRANLPVAGYGLPPAITAPKRCPPQSDATRPPHQISGTARGLATDARGASSYCGRSGTVVTGRS